MEQGTAPRQAEPGKAPKGAGDMGGGLSERQGKGWWGSDVKHELVNSLLRVVGQLMVKLSKVPEREVYHSLTWLCY